MSKYIIEIEDEPFVRKSCLYGEEGLYRASGFKSLVFDKTGLDKLESYDDSYGTNRNALIGKAFLAWVGSDEGNRLKTEEDVYEFLDKNSYDRDLAESEAYQRGLNDMWEYAKKLSLISQEEAEQIFPGAEKYNRFNLGYNGVEAFNKLKKYFDIKNENEFSVGDEIYQTSAAGNRIDFHHAIVTKVEKDGGISFVRDNGQVGHCTTRVETYWKKTGRHYQELAELLSNMKG